ncbi:MAG: anti-sigma factor [Planctomycetota bacterium]
MRRDPKDRRDPGFGNSNFEGQGYGEGGYAENGFGNAAYRDPNDSERVRAEVETAAALVAVEGASSAGVDTSHLDPVLLQRFESAAGALFSAMRPVGGPGAPGDLVERLIATTEPRAFGDATFERRASSLALAARRPQTERPTPARAARSVRANLVGFGGWAAAALLGLYVALGSFGGTSASSEPATVEDVRTVADAFGLRPDVSHSPWSVGDLTGEVVWSDADNAGYMYIDGLGVNDPEVAQYQLWIFRGQDPAAEPHPVDGGVFDVTTDGGVVVPIDAKIAVGSAGLFAVTVEEPGGVVVSERESIVAVAVRS